MTAERHRRHRRSVHHRRQHETAERARRLGGHQAVQDGPGRAADAAPAPEPTEGVEPQ